MDQGGAAGIGKKLAAQSNQAARGDAEFHAHAAGMMVDHFFHFAAARAEEFHHDADEIFRAIDDKQFERLDAAAVFGAHHDFGFAYHYLVAFAAHGLNQDRELQFAATQDAEGVSGAHVFDAERDVGEQFPVEARAQVARSDVLPLSTCEWRSIDGEDHRESGLVDSERLERRGIREIGDCLADLDAFDACDGDDVTGFHFLRFITIETAKGEKLGDLCGQNFPVKFRDANFGAANERSLENADDGDTAEKIAIVEIRDLDLQRSRRISRWRWNRSDNFIEQRLKVRGGIAKFTVRDAGLRIRVDDWKVELVFGGVEIDKEIVNFVEHFGRTRIGPVDFIQDDNRRKFCGERFLQHVARLRQRPFARVHENEDPIHHPESALDFTAKIAVTGRVDDIDFRVVIGERGVLGENRDAPFAFEIVRVHHPLDEFLVGAEDAALAEHGVDKGGLAVVDVGDDGDIANGGGHDPPLGRRPEFRMKIELKNRILFAIRTIRRPLFCWTYDDF